jgi:hypothetical protein
MLAKLASSGRGTLLSGLLALQRDLIDRTIGREPYARILGLLVTGLRRNTELWTKIPITLTRLAL